MDKLFFTGIKHSGKTTFAKMTAEALSLPVMDADDLVTPLLEGMTVREYYQTYGIDAFKKKETEAVATYTEQAESAFVLSLGGGACDNPLLMDYLKKNGKILYLRREEKDMLPVILNHGVPAFLDPNDLEGSFHKLYVRRDALYREQADLVLDLGPYGSKTETAARILEALKEAGYVR